TLEAWPIWCHRHHPLVFRADFEDHPKFVSHRFLPALNVLQSLISRCRDPILKAPPAQARGVLSGTSTLLLFPSWGKAALVWLRSDFRTDALRLWGYQSGWRQVLPRIRALLDSLVRVETSIRVPPLRGPGASQQLDEHPWGAQSDAFAILLLPRFIADLFSM